MFNPNQSVYVKVSSDYIPCTVISRIGNYYRVKSNDIGFGCSANRIITVEQYEELVKSNPPHTNYRPPGLH